MHTAAYKYETQQKYIDKTEIKQKLRSTIHGMGQLSSPFTIKNGIKTSRVQVHGLMEDWALYSKDTGNKQL